MLTVCVMHGSGYYRARGSSHQTNAHSLSLIICELCCKAGREIVVSTYNCSHENPYMHVQHLILIKSGVSFFRVPAGELEIPCQNSE